MAGTVKHLFGICSCTGWNDIFERGQELVRRTMLELSKPMNRLQPMSVPVVQCRATSRTGNRCKNKAIRGGTVCRFQSDASPHVASKAAVRAEVLNWGLGDTTVDPGEVLLRLVTQSAARAQRYASELEALVDEEGLTAAMVGEIEIPTKHGGYKAGEYVRGPCAARSTRT
jgi:hypothetical protein